MGDGDESDVFLGVQFHEQLAELVGGGLVECASGFIGEQELGLVDERAHHGHALAFAAGELAGPMRKAFAEAHTVEKVTGAFFVVGGGTSVGERGHEHVFHHRALRQQMMALKNKSHLAIAQKGEFVVI